MNTRKCWTAMLVGVLLLPKVAESADPSAEACQKGKACRKNETSMPPFPPTPRPSGWIRRVPPRIAVGGAYAGKGDTAKAIADCEEAIRLDPKLAEAYFVRGNAYNKSVTSTRPSPTTRRPSGSTRNSPRLCQPGLGLRKKGLWDKAIADFTEAIRLDPKDAEAY